MRLPLLQDLTRRDPEASERMDDPQCDVAALHRTYAQFEIVNRLVAGWQQAYRHHVRPVLRYDRINTLLDIGAGGADVTRAIARWAHRDGFNLKITAADPDKRAYAWAKRHHSANELEFCQAWSSELVSQGRRFDVVISNHLLHHLTDTQLRDLLKDSAHLARRRVVHSDIRRSRLAYTLFSVGTRPFFRGSFIREDGLTSIRRSYTVLELHAMAPAGWRVQAQHPWRNLLIYDAGASATTEPNQP